MAHDTFVVQIEGTDMFLTGYNPNDPPNSTFGNIDNAIEFDTLERAQEVALEIGGGTVGTPK